MRLIITPLTEVAKTLFDGIYTLILCISQKMDHLCLTPIKNFKIFEICKKCFQYLNMLLPMRKYFISFMYLHLTRYLPWQNFSEIYKIFQIFNITIFWCLCHLGGILIVFLSKNGLCSSIMILNVEYKLSLAASKDWIYISRFSTISTRPSWVERW